MITLFVIVALIALLAFWAMSIYNGLVTLRNRYKNAFSQIDVQLKRRTDLIPNLIETAKGFLSHEKETLSQVVSARTRAADASTAASITPGDPKAMRELMNAEGALGSALGKLIAVVEAYPDIKGNQPMMQLMEELSSTENKVGFARQAFNDSVMEYNTSREKFPDVFFATAFNFQAAELFEITDATERLAPKVTF